MVYHAAGWLEGGLIASPEKFIMDCEVLQMIQRYFEEATFATTETRTSPSTRSRRSGPGGHYFGVQHTQDRYQRRLLCALRVATGATMRPGRSTGRSGRRSARTGSTSRSWPSSRPPEMNGDHQEELRRFVAKRKQEGGAPTDF